MGIRRKLDSLMRRGFNTSKFKGSVNLAISRLAVLKNQRQARVKVARSDVVELLNLSSHERALLRVEQVMKEQNMLDVYVLLEGYCHLLIERVNLIEQEKECPDELVEAASSLIYAASRCGDFPELQEIRKIFSSHYGKDFVTRAVELRNKCGVNPKIVQKLSTKMPTLETKMKVLQDIATDNNIVMSNETTAPPIVQADEDSSKGNKENKLEGHDDDDVEEAVDFTESPKLRVKYRDVAHAAQAAFESAAYAAAAARAAVKLSRSESTDPDDPDPPKHQPRKISSATFDPTRDVQDEPKFDEELHPIGSRGWGPETENKTGSKSSSLSSTTADISADNIKEMETSSEEGNFDPNPLERDIVFDQSDEENNEGTDPGSGINNSTVKYYPLHTRAGFKTEPEFELQNISEFDTKTGSSEPLNINRRPISVRTKWRQGM